MIVTIYEPLDQSWTEKNETFYIDKWDMWLVNAEAPWSVLASFKSSSQVLLERG